ncbi:MAG: hypothetical protein QMD21_07835, partial [Candidatus Thermoplasmatota archaeon]|nr:hypothetical protein [Candidatus Thermoplasmatota archaeon]
VGKQTLTLSKGWNSIGRFNETAIYASELAKSIENCAAIGYWDEALGRFVVHLVSTGLSDFKIEPGNGYLVYVTQTTAWENK